MGIRISVRKDYLTFANCMPSRSGYILPMRIRITVRIKESQINADPYPEHVSCVTCCRGEHGGDRPADFGGRSRWGSQLSSSSTEVHRQAPTLYSQKLKSVPSKTCCGFFNGIERGTDVWENISWYLRKNFKRLIFSWENKNWKSSINTVASIYRSEEI